MAAGSANVAGQHVGLSNVRARLEQLYGGDSRFEMTNGAAQGLTVTLQIPFRSDESA